MAGDWLPEKAKFILGWLEAGGSMGLTISMRKTTGRIKSVTPSVQMGADNREDLACIQEMTGNGYLRQISQNHFQLQFSPLKSQEIAEALSADAVFRRTHIAAFRESGQVALPDRATAARRLQIFNRQPDLPNREEYCDLIDDPNFLAGVFTGRGRIGRHQDSPELIIHTQNKGLLDAVAQKYGGVVNLHHEKGTDVNVKNARGEKVRRGVTQMESFRLVIAFQDQLENLCVKMLPGLRTRNKVDVLEKVLYRNLYNG